MEAGSGGSHLRAAGGGGRASAGGASVPAHVVIDILEGVSKEAEKAKGVAPWQPSSRPVSHGEQFQSRGQFQGTTQGTGQQQFPSVPPQQLVALSSPFPFTSPLSGGGYVSTSHGGGSGHSFQAMTFPQFDGENLRLWKIMCEQYFAMYGIDKSFWLPMATLNFSNTTTIWLQSVQRKVSGLNWEGFVSFYVGSLGSISTSS